MDFAKDKELEEFRSIMEVPSTFEDGFSWSSLLGTLFLALVMIPGSIYMQLVAGRGIGPAAQWVTLILFVEVARRANARMTRAQLFIIAYMCSLVMGQQIHGTLLFRQYLVRSDAAISFGLAGDIPSWVAPAESDRTRGFFTLKWLPVIGLIVFTRFFGTINAAIMGYGLFRQTSDIEKLPFPMAPLGAQGILTLAEQVEGGDEENEEKSSRWRVFCMGTGLGLGFGSIYLALPTITGALFGSPLVILPIPFVDWTNYTKDILPAFATGLSLNLGQLIMGMVLPFFAMLGGFIGLIITFVANPLLYKLEVLQTWEPGDSTVETLFKNTVDFYFSFGIGISLAIATIGIIGMVKHYRTKKDERREDGVDDTAPPKGRGDIPGKIVFVSYVVCTAVYIVLSMYLIGWKEKGVLAILLFYGILYTPLISYVTAKLEGLAGQVVEIPFIKELSFILSGYTGVAIWFIPVPKANFGTQTMFYRQAELLGTKFTSIWKANLILFPIIIASTICFSSFIWRLGDVPSPQYPFAETMWPLRAKNACLLYSSTLGEYSPFAKALSFWKFALGYVLSMATYFIMSAFSLPVMLYYGVIRGLNQTLPHTVILQFTGALLGRYYFGKKVGKNWRKVITSFSAGYMVGNGLISMVSIGIVFLAKSTSTLQY